MEKVVCIVWHRWVESKRAFVEQREAGMRALLGDRYSVRGVWCGMRGSSGCHRRGSTRSARCRSTVWWRSRRRLRPSARLCKYSQKRSHCLAHQIVLVLRLRSARRQTRAAASTMAAVAGGRVTAGAGANLLGVHGQARNQEATLYVGNLDNKVRCCDCCCICL